MLYTFPNIHQLFDIRLSSNFSINKDDNSINGPFGFNYKYPSELLSPPTSTTHNFFVFSIFASKELISFSHLKHDDLTDEQYEKITNNQMKYTVNAIKTILEFLNNTLWKDFGVMILLDKSMDSYILNKDVISEKPTAKQYFIQQFSDFIGNRVVFIDINCNNLDLCLSEYAVTCARFSAMCMKVVDIAVWRDAHSTMPNPYTFYDAKWCEHWIKLNKRFWAYEMVNYNPKHNMFRNTMFAATWAGKKLDGDTTIATPDIWKHFEDGMTIVKNLTYGIDEKLFIYFVNDPQFLKDIYIVGVIQFPFLFYNKADLSQWRNVQNSSGKKIDKFQDITPEVITALGGDLNLTLSTEVNMDLNDYGLITFPYFSETPCIINYINEVLKSEDENQDEMSLNELMMNIEKIKNSHSSSLSDKILRKILKIIPSRWHIWEFLFDGPDKDLINSLSLSSMIRSYNVEKYSDMGDGWRIDPENRCDIIEKFFKGGEFSYGKYRYINKKLGKKHLDLPENISIPPDYDNGEINFIKTKDEDEDED